MQNHRVFKMAFSSVYPHYIAKAEKKNRTKAEVDQIIYWLTGYNEIQLKNILDSKPLLNPFLQKLLSSMKMPLKLRGSFVGIELKKLKIH